jgi:hypothetical protein
MRSSIPSTITYCRSVIFINRSDGWGRPYFGPTRAKELALQRRRTRPWGIGLRGRSLVRSAALGHGGSSLARDQCALA